MFFSDNSDLKAQLRRVERKLDAIIKHLDIRTDDPPLDELCGPDIQVLLASGKKIEAIKLYRERTGVGLKEAKDFIDGL